MPRWPILLLLGMAAACSRSEKPPGKHAAPLPKHQDVRITQFYTTATKIAPGEKALLCYGVENAKSVWLTPARQGLSPSLSRCLEVAPEKTTTYTITAEGDGGRVNSPEITVTVGAARAKIIEVNVSALQIKPGDLLSICYKVQNAASVRIDPIRYRKQRVASGCATHQPRETTTYVVIARGVDGDEDREQVTVKVE